MNDMLIKYFLSSKEKTNLDPSVLNIDNVFKVLNTTFSNWTYEIESVLGNDGNKSVVVALYLPGRIQTGVAKIEEPANKNLDTAICQAILNAISTSYQKGTNIDAKNVGQVPTPVDCERNGNTGNENQKPKKFSNEQINKVKKIKADFNITNDAAFCNLIHSWNPDFTRKEDLTPENIDSFIDWANSTKI